MYTPKAPLIYPTIGTAPVAGTTAGIYYFVNRVSTAKPVAEIAEAMAGWIVNNTGQTMYVRFGPSAASTVNWDVLIPTGETRPIYFTHKRLSIWFPATATVNAVGGMGGSTDPATYAIVGIPSVQESAPSLE
jgi:hypothetical protein